MLERDIVVFVNVADKKTNQLIVLGTYHMAADMR